MKAIRAIIVLSLCIAFFNTCKKYPEGGWISLTRKHLFGGHKVGDSKTWKLKLYEVNGVDSTDIIKQSLPNDFFEVKFTLTNSKDIALSANSVFYFHGATIDRVYKKLAVGTEDTSDCKTYGNSNYCVRDFLFPERNKWSKNWDIKKLTAKEFVLETNWNLKNSYKIILVP